MLRKMTSKTANRNWQLKRDHHSAFLPIIYCNHRQFIAIWSTLSAHNPFQRQRQEYMFVLISVCFYSCKTAINVLAMTGSCVCKGGSKELYHNYILYTNCSFCLCFSSISISPLNCRKMVRQIYRHDSSCQVLLMKECQKLWFVTEKYFSSMSDWFS